MTRSTLDTGICATLPDETMQPRRAPVSGQRCPHDGGYCHHACGDTCSRKEDGSHLTKPHDGYPVDSDAPQPGTETLDIPRFLRKGTD